MTSALVSGQPAQTGDDRGDPALVEATKEGYGNTMFALAFDERRPDRMSCATNGGEVFSSSDAGETWQAHPPLPEGKQIYALARA